MSEAFGRLLSRVDGGAVFVAVVVGLAAALCLFRLRSRMRHSRGTVRLAWIFLSGAVGGAGCWGAEMTALSAFRPGVPVAFDPVGVLVALLISVIGAGAGLAIAWTGRDKLRMATGGIVAALAASGTHFAAVGAYRLPAQTTWDPMLVWTAMLLCIVGYVAALLGAGSAKSFRRQAAGALGLGFGTLSLHLVSLAGYAVVPDPAMAPSAGVIGGGVVTFIALTLAVLMTLGGLGAAYIDDVSSRSALARSRRLAEAAREGIVVLSVRTGEILDCNAAFSTMAGADVDALIGLPLARLLALEDGGELEHGRTIEGVLRGADGEAVPVEAHARPLHELGEDAEPTTVVSIRDLRDERAAQDHIRFLAEHDPLTGLPNRALMNRAIAERIDGGVILSLIRIANHAEINSLYGHAVGDAVLAKAAERLKRFESHPLPGYTCMAARLGSAELAFVVFGEPDLAAAPAFTAALTKSLRRAVTAETLVVEPKVSIGVSASPQDAFTVAELVRHAEVALESASRDSAGADGVVYFRQDLQDEVVAQRTLLHDLRTGIAENQLVVHYQPQARTGDASLCGFEALVRWIHPVRGFMPPDSFIPAAEQSGLIIELGEQVLRRACADAVAWPHPVPVAVNLSPLQVGQVDLPRLVHQVLMETGLPPSRLELEITESALFRDYQRALDTLRRLKALGVKIAMDDFGTGFSSLSTLQSFPFDKIKIDKSFVNGAGSLERSTVIVKAVLGIGRGLDIPVVAEGVETAEQMAFLRDEGCPVIQGYHIGKPGRIETHQALFDALDAGDRPVAALRRSRTVAAA